ncbi:hypothetical protein B7P43_G01019 [Cryptotermes secundus]|uniref:EB domain-containing protein n=1 Tax=Cryptotermes secundus TaxID=105785 RepID=A0A2J7PGF5_9NEOP|nr:uncharacterized protein LOC111874214 [Cryptotermes secundus]XP_023725297.1 uncharacterized protein LOC111874214 [Cryptotermes secundus]XP_023725298.1 uncharacterized protein LOC111874214 [Cryptotermes secundus]XP_023725299.1 uncharacterized protein LOC111874214 [Cryptotermes secundus]XP_023725300.1 uncharacterized protein LOC111874214 [Cryptotermes secundus]PNF15415.1 hypothetical protein B7P43_G01019 [Cryptotermes secundus]
MTWFVTAVWYTGAVFLLILLSSCGGQQIRNYGETCFSDVECMDRHMLCQSTERDSNVTRCYCDRFYSWHEELKECVQADNISLGLPTLEQQDIVKQKSQSEHKMFIKISIVGLIAVISISVFLLSCIAYGCCSCTRVSNTKTNEPATSCPPTCPLHHVPLLQQDKLDADQEKKKQWRDMPCPIPTALDDVDIC